MQFEMSKNQKIWCSFFTNPKLGKTYDIDLRIPKCQNLEIGTSTFVFEHIRKINKFEQTKQNFKDQTTNKTEVLPVSGGKSEIGTSAFVYLKRPNFRDQKCHKLELGNQKLEHRGCLVGKHRT